VVKNDESERESLRGRFVESATRDEFSVYFYSAPDLLSTNLKVSSIRGVFRSAIAAAYTFDSFNQSRGRKNSHAWASREPGSGW
jgi:hypothetical protein